MPKVSVVIPTYNREKYLPDAINSVLNQTYKDFEIIIVDDGSRDNTKEVVESFMKKYPHIPIRYFYQENKGPAAARNRGIKEAKGEYIAFLDSDDVWLPAKLEKEVQVLDKDKHCGLVYTDAYEFDRRGIIKNSKLATNDRSKMSGMIFENLILGCFIFTSTVMVRKWILEEVKGFNTEFVPAEDWELWLRIARVYKIVFVDEVLVGYRKEGSRISDNLKLSSLSRHKVIERIFNTRSITPKEYYLKKLSHSAIFFEIGWIYLKKRRDSESARKEFVKYIVNNPLDIKGYYFFIQTFFPTSYLCKLEKYTLPIKKKVRNIFLWKK